MESKQPEPSTPLRVTTAPAIPEGIGVIIRATTTAEGFGVLAGATGRLGQFKTVEQKLCALRSFLRFASGDGLIDATVLDTVPTVKSRKQTRIPSAPQSEQIIRPK